MKAVNMLPETLYYKIKDDAIHFPKEKMLIRSLMKSETNWGFLPSALEYFPIFMVASQDD